MTIASRIAQRLAAAEQLQLLLPPIAIAGFEVAMAWRSVVTNDPAVMWLRQELGEIGQIN